MTLRLQRQHVSPLKVGQNFLASRIVRQKFQFINATTPFQKQQRQITTVNKTVPVRRLPLFSPFSVSILSLSLSLSPWLSLSLQAFPPKVPRRRGRRHNDGHDHTATARYSPLFLSLYFFNFFLVFPVYIYYLYIWILFIFLFYWHFLDLWILFVQ